ncbi:MAG: motility associated factor glycosyltransferase family protein [Treponema sp.]|nr:motility associated factor glycosyltransferase family protein [Candidatus Treponema merdequi]
MNLNYSQIIKSKDGFDIPLFNDKKAMHSKYAPLREALSFGSEVKNSSSYTVILGLGGGYHVQSFKERNPEHTIIVIEKSQKDIEFLSEINCVKELLNDKKIIIIPQDQIENSIKKTYLPVFFDEINIIPNRAWFDNDTENSKSVINKINSTIKECSGDYSVQVNFGLIWQNNIINNLLILSKLKLQNLYIDSSKKAAVIAAGPSLDFTLQKIINNRNEYFVIATDTAFSSLSKFNITSDAVLSIDGQNISETHFLGVTDDKTIFIFDLQANFNAVNYVKQFSDRIIFTKSGHPFAEFAELSQNRNIFSKLNSGGGTVTIAAVDFAKLCGFSKIEVFGADFSYINNKPYTRGTYLDKLYRKNETKINPAENSFTNLLYRTPVITENSETCRIIRTEILNLYKKTFIDWIKENNFEYKYDSYIYSLNQKNFTSQNISVKNADLFLQNQAFDFNLFIDFIKNNIKPVSENSTYKNLSDLTNLQISLLPLISYLKKKNTRLSFTGCLKLANNMILDYTKVL